MTEYTNPTCSLPARTILVVGHSYQHIINSEIKCFAGVRFKDISEPLPNSRMNRPNLEIFLKDYNVTIKGLIIQSKNDVMKTYGLILNDVEFLPCWDILLSSVDDKEYIKYMISTRVLRYETLKQHK